MRHLFYLHNLPLPDKVAAQKKIKNKIPARLYIYFPYGEISNNTVIKLCYSMYKNETALIKKSDARIKMI